MEEGEKKVGKEGGETYDKRNSYLSSFRWPTNLDNSNNIPHSPPSLFLLPMYNSPFLISMLFFQSVSPLTLSLHPSPFPTSYLPHPSHSPTPFHSL